MSGPLLLAIVEMGGYPDFTSLYCSAGFLPAKMHSVRKAQTWLKKNRPQVVVTEFHFDPELRDRMSNLESLFAMLQRYAPDAKVVVFIEKAHRPRLEKVVTRFPVFASFDYPVDADRLGKVLQTVASGD